MIEEYIITERTYVPKEQVKYLELTFEKIGSKLLGDVLTFYGRDINFLERVLEDILEVVSVNLESNTSKFWSFIDDGIKEDTGYNLGEVTVISNPEYYPNIFYRKSNDEIIVLPISIGEQSPYFIDRSKFLAVAGWWLGICTYYSKFIHRNNHLA